MKNEINNNETSSKTPFRGLGGNPYKTGGMFEGANYLLFEKAKELRKNMTPAETMLWMYLKEGLNDLKFRRQHPIGLYIADFYCHKVKLIVEVDGSIHNQQDVKESDEVRQKELDEWGFNVIRFSNQEVIQQIDRVVAAITKKIIDLINFQKLNASSKNGV